MFSPYIRLGNKKGFQNHIRSRSETQTGPKQCEPPNSLPQVVPHELTRRSCPLLHHMCTCTRPHASVPVDHGAPHETAWEMAWTVRNGPMDRVKLLHTHGPRPCTTPAGHACRALCPGQHAAGHACRPAHLQGRVSGLSLLHACVGRI